MQAYKDTVEKQGRTPPSLPSLDSYTDEQMFFIAFGQVCLKNNKVTLDIILYTISVCADLVCYVHTRVCFFTHKVKSS